MYLLWRENEIGVDMSLVVSVGDWNLLMMVGLGRNPISTFMGGIGISRRPSSSCRGSSLSWVFGRCRTCDLEHFNYFNIWVCFGEFNDRFFIFF